MKNLILLATLTALNLTIAVSAKGAVTPKTLVCTTAAQPANLVEIDYTFPKITEIRINGKSKIFQTTGINRSNGFSALVLNVKDNVNLYINNNPGMTFGFNVSYAATSAKDFDAVRSSQTTPMKSCKIVDSSSNQIPTVSF